MHGGMPPLRGAPHIGSMECGCETEPTVQRGGQRDVIGEGIVSQLNLSSTEDTPFAHPPAPASRPTPARRLARLRAAAVQALILAAIVSVVLIFLEMIWSG